MRIGDGEFFILEADGESMKNIGIDPGDLVVIRRQDTARRGEIVVALDGGESTLKRYYPEARRIVLKPENPDFPDIVIPEERMADFRIQGVAIKIVKDAK